MAAASFKSRHIQQTEQPLQPVEIIHPEKAKQPKSL